MFHKPLYVREVWRLGWEWWPKNWCTFGWHTVPYDGVVYKALNLGPLSIHNDFIPEADLMALIEGPKAKLIAERETLIAENEHKHKTATVLDGSGYSAKLLTKPEHFCAMFVSKGG